MRPSYLTRLVLTQPDAGGLLENLFPQVVLAALHLPVTAKGLEAVEAERVETGATFIAAIAGEETLARILASEHRVARGRAQCVRRIIPAAVRLQCDLAHGGVKHQRCRAT
jgi:hypothetical protein